MRGDSSVLTALVGFLQEHQICLDKIVTIQNSSNNIYHVTFPFYALLPLGALFSLKAEIHAYKLAEMVIRFFKVFDIPTQYQTHDIGCTAIKLSTQLCEIAFPLYDRRTSVRHSDSRLLIRLTFGM